MTDNKITREMTFSEELPYFRERIKEIFDNYDNPDGYADTLYLSALSDSYCIVRKAEEEITRQQEEIENLTYTLLGVMHSVDKWLDGTELEQDEVNRAATMREKTLRIVEEKQEDIERLKGYPYATHVEVSKKLESQIKSEAVKEFAKRLKCGVPQETGVIRCYDVDNLVKEMVGDKE